MCIHLHDDNNNVLMRLTSLGYGFTTFIFDNVFFTGRLIFICRKCAANKTAWAQPAYGPNFSCHTVAENLPHGL